MEYINAEVSNTSQASDSHAQTAEPVEGRGALVEFSLITLMVSVAVLGSLQITGTQINTSSISLSRSYISTTNAVAPLKDLRPDQDKFIFSP